MKEEGASCSSATGPESFVKVEGNMKAEIYLQTMKDNLTQPARQLRLL